MSNPDPVSGHFDAIVIGGGIVGCMSAFWLARRGLKVALVERAVIAGGTTANSFAWINATSKVADESYHRLNALGAAVYRELVAEFGEARLGLNPTGMLKLVSRSDEASYAATREQASRLERYGYPVGWVGARELAALEPHLRLDADVEALHAMADPCLDAPSCARFIAGQVREMDSSVFEQCRALELETDDAGAVSAVLTDRGRLVAKRVLVAAGPGTPEVLSELTGYDAFASRFPMNRVPGLLVTSPTTAPFRLVRHVLYRAGGDEFHVLPAPNGGLKIGADDTDGLVAGDPTPAQINSAASALLKRARELIPSFAGEACLAGCKVGIGVRPYPSDGKTLAGPLPGADGLFVIATHSGITLSPAVGKLMAELIAEGRTPAELAPFGLDRFQAFAR